MGLVNQKTVTGKTALIKSGETGAFRRQRTRIFAYPRQKPLGRLTRIYDDFLEVKCGQMWCYETPGSHSHEGFPLWLPFPPGIQSGSPREDWKELPCRVLAEVGKQQAQLNPFPSSSI